MADDAYVSGIEDKVRLICQSICFLPLQGRHRITRAHAPYVHMLNLEIPGFGTLRLEHLVLDYNGTLALDGNILPGVTDRLSLLERDLQIHILTANTFGKAGAELADVPFVRLTILETQGQAEAKRSYVQELGSRITACIGNGRNDRLMLQEAALGIAVVQSEGAAGDALRAAHITARDIVEALDLLNHPLRLVATLRG